MSIFNCTPKPKPCCVSSYAQYGVQSNPPSGSDLSLLTIFQEGSLVDLNSTTEISLAPGYLYLVDYIFLATTEANSYMQITPKINGTLNLFYSYFAPSGTPARNTSASGSFTTNAAISEEAVLSFAITYPEAVRNIDISGAISVTPLFQIQQAD